MGGATDPLAVPPAVGSEAAALAALLRRVGDADQAALASFYDRTSARVYSLVLRILGDRTSAEEVTVDVYMQAFRQAPGYDPTRGTPMAWLLNLARSRAIDRARADRRRQRYLVPLGEDAQPVSPSRGPDESLSGADLARVVRAALATLGAEQRLALEMAHYSGLTQGEIAAELGVPLGTVKTRMRTGMMALRERLRAVLGEART
jgi:RNA polymerase sigma-70 factor (ECF subfamily)